MEDLIPLLIVIAISIIGAVSNKKKREAAKNITHETKTKSQDNEFLHWLEKLGVEDNEISPYHEEKPAHVEETKPVVNQQTVEVKQQVKEAAFSNKYAKFGGFITQEEREQIMANEGISSLKNNITEHDLTNKEEKTEEKAKEKQISGFDLRQAVIFSEILNRKYV